MTDRFNYLTVSLERDIREDDAEALLNAIRMLKGVVDVAGNVTDPGLWAAEVRVRQELGRGLRKVLYPDSP